MQTSQQHGHGQTGSEIRTVSTPVDASYFVNFATVLNKYLGLCLFSSKRDTK